MPFRAYNVKKPTIFFHHHFLFSSSGNVQPRPMISHAEGETSVLATFHPDGEPGSVRNLDVLRTKAKKRRSTLALANEKLPCSFEGEIANVPSVGVAISRGWQPALRPAAQRAAKKQAAGKSISYENAMHRVSLADPSSYHQTRSQWPEPPARAEASRLVTEAAAAAAPHRTGSIMLSFGGEYRRPVKPATPGSRYPAKVRHLERVHTARAAEGFGLERPAQEAVERALLPQLSAQGPRLYGPASPARPVQPLDPGIPPAIARREGTPQRLRLETTAPTPGVSRPGPVPLDPRLVGAAAWVAKMEERHRSSRPGSRQQPALPRPGSNVASSELVDGPHFGDRPKSPAQVAAGRPPPLPLPGQPPAAAGERLFVAALGERAISPGGPAGIRSYYGEYGPLTSMRRDIGALAGAASGMRSSGHTGAAAATAAAAEGQGGAALGSAPGRWSEAEERARLEELERFLTSATAVVDDAGAAGQAGPRGGPSSSGRWSPGLRIKHVQR